MIVREAWACLFVDPVTRVIVSWGVYSEQAPTQASLRLVCIPFAYSRSETYQRAHDDVLRVATNVIERLALRRS